MGGEEGEGVLMGGKGERNIVYPDLRRSERKKKGVVIG